MGKMLVWGLIASAFFSTSFVLYQLMSVQGGHWFWSASFRCFFMWLLLSVFILLLHTPMPSGLSFVGIALVIIGLVLFAKQR